MKKVSIIIPVYNNEKHLKRCIESALIQKNENFEVLIINDGSTKWKFWSFNYKWWFNR